MDTTTSTIAVQLRALADALDKIGAPATPVTPATQMPPLDPQHVRVVAMRGNYRDMPRPEIVGIQPENGPFRAVQTIVEYASIIAADSPIGWACRDPFDYNKQGGMLMGNAEAIEAMGRTNGKVGSAAWPEALYKAGRGQDWLNEDEYAVWLTQQPNSPNDPWISHGTPATPTGEVNVPIGNG